MTPKEAGRLWDRRNKTYRAPQPLRTDGDQLWPAQEIHHGPYLNFEMAAKAYAHDFESGMAVVKWVILMLRHEYLELPCADKALLPFSSPWHGIPMHPLDTPYRIPRNPRCSS